MANTGLVEQYLRILGHQAQATLRHTLRSDLMDPCPASGAWPSLRLGEANHEMGVRTGMKDLRCGVGWHHYVAGAPSRERTRTDRSDDSKNVYMECTRCRKSKFVTLMERASVQRERWS